MNNILQASRSLGIRENVLIRVLDRSTGKVVQEHRGHNMATNTMLLGIAHYLTGDGVLNQGSYMLSEYVPKYISLGTMGLINQDSDDNGLPAGIGVEIPDMEDEEYQSLVDAMNRAKSDLDAAKEALANDCPYYVEYGTCYTGQECGECSERLARKRSDLEAAQLAYDEAKKAVMNYSEERRFRDYMLTRPGYGADGYDEFENNSRKYFGLGPAFSDRPDKTKTINCELISDSYPRVDISSRDIVPEIEAELPQTIDVVFSAMVSTGALKQFRETDKSYVYITECGLWSRKYWEDSGDNGLLAAYRIAPPNEWNWEVVSDNVSYFAKSEYAKAMGVDLATVTNDDVALYNRNLLKSSIIKVNVNQVVQVIWKIQLGSIDQFANISQLRKNYYDIDTDDKCPYCGKELG